MLYAIVIVKITNKTVVLLDNNELPITRQNNKKLQVLCLLAEKIYRINVKIEI